MKDITGPGRTREFAEFTHQQSSGGYREYTPAFRPLDPGPLWGQDPNTYGSAVGVGEGRSRQATTRPVAVQNMIS